MKSITKRVTVGSDVYNVTVTPIKKNVVANAADSANASQTKSKQKQSVVALKTNTSSLMGDGYTVEQVQAWKSLQSFKQDSTNTSTSTSDAYLLNLYTLYDVWASVDGAKAFRPLQPCSPTASTQRSLSQP